MRWSPNFVACGLLFKSIIVTSVKSLGHSPVLYMVLINFVIVKGKGKAVPLQAWTGPGGTRKLRFPDFVTTAQDADRVVSLTHRPPLPQGSTPGTHLC